MEHLDLAAEYSDESECDCNRSSSSEEECDCMRDYLQSEEIVETCSSQNPLAVVDQQQALPDIVQQPVEVMMAQTDEQVVDEIPVEDRALETVEEAPAVGAQTEVPMMEESQVEEVLVEEKVEVQPEVEQVEMEAVQMAMDEEQTEQVDRAEEVLAADVEQCVPLAVEPEAEENEENIIEEPVELEQTPVVAENAVEAVETEPEEQQSPLAVEAAEPAEIEQNDASLVTEEIQQQEVPLVDQEVPLEADIEAVSVEEAQQDEPVVEAVGSETSEMVAVESNADVDEMNAEAPEHVASSSPSGCIDSEISENFNKTIIKKNRPPRPESLKHKVELTLRFESDVESGFEVMVVPAEPQHVRGRIAEFERIIATTSTVAPSSASSLANNSQQEPEHQQQQPVNRVLPLCSTKWSNKKEDVPQAEPETPKVIQAVKLFESFKECARADARKNEVHSPRCLGGIDSPILSSRRFDLSNAPPSKLAGEKLRACGEVVYEPVPEVKSTLRTFETLKRSANRKVIRTNVRPAYRSKM